MALHAPVVSPAAGPLLDVRPSHGDSHGSSDEEVKDIFAYGAGLRSTNAIVGLSDFTNLQTLSLHGNQIERIEGLEVLHQLVALNLSSNNITWMEGLSQLKMLRVLNLSNNRIREIAGLQGLVALRTLILSHNEIHLLGGLSAMHGLPYALQHLDLRDNVVQYLCELWILGGCPHLEEVLFQSGGYANPVCQASAYRSTLLSIVPRLQSLDGTSCVGETSLLNTDLLCDRVPSSWTSRHSHPGIQIPVSAGPPSLPHTVENQIVSCTPYILRPTTVLEDTRPEARGSRVSPDGEHIHCFGCSGVVPGNPRETGGFKPQDQLQKPDSRPVSNPKTPPLKATAYQGRHCLQKCHESSNHHSQATQEHENRDNDGAKPDGNSYRVITPTSSGQGATWGSAPSNDEKLTLDDALDNELLGNPCAGAAGIDNSRHVRFVGKNCKPALPVLSQLRLPGASDKTTQTSRELATQTESVSPGPTSDQVPRGLEVKRLQSNFGTITVVIDGNSSCPGIGKQNVLENLELNEKNHNESLLYLAKEKKFLKDEFAAFKRFADRERDAGHGDDNNKSIVLRSLEMNLKGCRSDLNNLRETVMQIEKELITEVKHVESSIKKHFAETDTIKLSSLSAEIVALKDALNSALNTCQTVGTALNDANHQKEKAKRALVSLTAALDDQRSKVKIVTEMLENCTHQERRSRRECIRLKSELDLACQALRKNRDRETEDLVRVQSAVWEARGREEAETLWQKWADELHRRLVDTQAVISQVLQGNANTLSSVTKLRDTMIEKILELSNAIEAVTERERGAKELITELSFVVSAQKKRSECMQLELDRLVSSKQLVHHEAERLQAEILRLQERSASATEQKALEVEALRRELANVTSTAEEAARTRFASLLLENEKLATRAASLAQKLQESQNIILAKSDVCANQEAIIQQLKEELIEAKNAACISEANIKVLEADLIQRLQYEVEQKCELRNELTMQETIISEIEEELKISKREKHKAEQACKSLQEKVDNVDLLLRHVDEEINGVKTLYEDREKAICLERDDALAKVIAMQKKLEDAEAATTSAMQAHFEATKSMEAKEQKTNATLIQKDILIDELKSKVSKVEADLHSRDLALEIQKAISSAKVEQLGKVLEELREVT